MPKFKYSPAQKDIFKLLKTRGWKPGRTADKHPMMFKKGRAAGTRRIALANVDTRAGHLMFVSEAKKPHFGSAWYGRPHPRSVDTLKKAWATRRRKYGPSGSGSGKGKRKKKR